jgi:hypothetical protein
VSIDHWPKRKAVSAAPQHSAQELADEFGISVKSFSALLANRNGPKHIRKTTGRYTRTYFDAAEVRNWWSTVKETL